MSARLDLTEQVFGRLTIKEFFGVRKKHSQWKAKCSCGNLVTVSSSNLVSGHTKSCGCLSKELSGKRGKKTIQAAQRARTSHGHTRGGKVTPEYKSYEKAKERCLNPNSINYYNYGGRGIKFLFESFEQFYSELGPRPSGMSLDRIDNDGNYEPGNVRWASKSQQNSNQRPRKNAA